MRYFPCRSDQSVGKAQPQSELAIILHGGHAQLATGGLILAPQDEELVRPGLPPVPPPLLMRRVTIGLKGILPAPETPGAEAEPNPACDHVSPKSIEAVAEILKTPPLVMDNTQFAALQGVRNLLISTGYPPPQALKLTGLTHTNRGYLALKRYPETVEHTGRYAVGQKIAALQRREGNTSAVTAKKFTLKAAVEFGIGRQRGNALLGLKFLKGVNPVLIGEAPLPDLGGAGLALLISRRRHEYIISERAFR